MARGIVAGWKIDKAAKIMTDHLKDEINDKVKSMENIMISQAKKTIPKDVLSFFEKHKERFYKESNFCFDVKFQNRSYYYLYFRGQIPTLTEEERKSVKNAVLSEIEKEFSELDGLYNKKNELSNKIKCTLSKLNTYKKIKENFPEAYSTIVSVIDSETVVDSEGNLCDNVEELRAVLNNDKSKK